MKLKLSLFLAIAAAVVTALSIAPTASPAPPASSALALPVSGVTCTAGGVTAPCTLTATLNGFTAQNGQLLAQVTATLTNLTTGATQTVNLLLPAVVNNGSCSILDLTIQPIHLDLLGLVVDTNTIHLQITAQSGPGNLLGNLLCSVAHLLDSNGSTTGLAAVLNNLLRSLGL
jgi:hypothetical protein